MFKTTTLFILLLSAQVTLTNIAFAKGDPSAGKDKSIICSGCHGIDGNNDNSEYPILAGQHQAYLLKQLKDFKAGDRVDDHMTSMVNAVPESDFEDITAYFSSNKPQKSAKKESESTLGKNIFNNGIENKSVTACVSCHGAKGEGDQSGTFPSIKSQHHEYLKKILKDFRAGKRSNDNGMMMRNIATKLSDQEINALATYISSLK